MLGGTDPIGEYIVSLPPQQDLSNPLNPGHREGFDISEMLLKWNGVVLLTEAHLRFFSANWGWAEKGYALLRDNRQWDDKMKLMLAATTPLGCSPPNTIEEWNPPQHAYPSNGESLASLIACTLEIAMRCQENYNGVGKISPSDSLCGPQALEDAISYLRWMASQFNKKAWEANQTLDPPLYTQIYFELIGHSEAPTTPFLHPKFQQWNAVSSQNIVPSAIQAAQWTDASTSAPLFDPSGIWNFQSETSTSQPSWLLDQKLKKLTSQFHGKEYPLTADEFSLLQALARADGKGLTIEKLGSYRKTNVRTSQIICSLKTKLKSDYDELIKRYSHDRYSLGKTVRFLPACISTPTTAEELLDAPQNNCTGQQYWVVNKSKNCIISPANNKIKLSAKELSLFEKLASGEFVHRDKLSRDLKGGNVDHLHQLIDGLLRKLRPNGRDVIKTHNDEYFSLEEGYFIDPAKGLLQSPKGEEFYLTPAQLSLIEALESHKGQYIKIKKLREIMGKSDGRIRQIKSELESKFASHNIIKRYSHHGYSLGKTVRVLSTVSQRDPHGNLLGAASYNNTGQGYWYVNEDDSLIISPHNVYHPLTPAELKLFKALASDEFVEANTLMQGLGKDKMGKVRGLICGLRKKLAPNGVIPPKKRGS